jgi:hypothetical protein
MITLAAGQTVTKLEGNSICRALQRYAPRTPNNQQLVYSDYAGVVCGDYTTQSPPVFVVIVMMIQPCHQGSHQHITCRTDHDWTQQAVAHAAQNTACTHLLAICLWCLFECVA